MNALLATAIIVGLFFAIGVIVGIISVIAMAAIRAEHKHELPGPSHDPPAPDSAPNPDSDPE